MRVFSGSAGRRRPPWRCQTASVSGILPAMAREKLTQQLNVLVEPAVLAAVNAAAEARGWTVAQWVRDAIRRALADEGITIATPKSARRSRPG